MNRQETVALCRYAKACCPQQAIDEYTPDAWHDLLGDLSLDDARAAVCAVAKRQPFVAPAEIRAEVRRVRAERLANVNQIIPPADPATWTRALKEINRRVGDGQSAFRTVPALEAGEVRHSEDASDYRSLREAWQAEKEAEAAQKKADKEARIAAAFAEQESRREADLAYSVMITLTDEESLTAYQLAREELGTTATREQIMIRAVQLADHTKTRPVETDTSGVSARSGCRHGCSVLGHEHPCPKAGVDSPIGRGPECDHCNDQPDAGRTCGHCGKAAYR